MNTTILRDDAIREFISSLARLEATAPTWCPGYSAHDLTAHVTAAAEERADLIDEHLAGKPTRATRSWDVREPPFRAIPDWMLRERLVEHAVRFESSVAALTEDDTIGYTGWSKGLSETESGHGVVIELRPHELPLLLWGRCPPRLRDPNTNTQTVEDVITRLCLPAGASGDFGAIDA